MDLGCAIILPPLAQNRRSGVIYTSSLSFVLQGMNADSYLVKACSWRGRRDTRARLRACVDLWHSCKCFSDDRLLLPDRDGRDRIRFLAGKARGGEGE